MKNELKSAKPSKLYNTIILRISKNDVLSCNAMNSIRGGDEEGNGGADIIIIPKPK